MQYLENIQVKNTKYIHKHIHTNTPMYLDPEIRTFSLLHNIMYDLDSEHVDYRLHARICRSDVTPSAHECRSMMQCDAK